MLVVLVENTDLKLLTPPTAEGTPARVPNAWLRETPAIVLDLTGGMRADIQIGELGESSSLAHGGEATPSLHSVVGSHVSERCSAGTPSVHSLALPSGVDSHGTGTRPRSLGRKVANRPVPQLWLLLQNSRQGG